MRFPTLCEWISVIVVMFFGIVEGEEYPADVFVCPDAASLGTELRCSWDEVIEIHSVTYAHLRRVYGYPCDDAKWQILHYINRRESDCKLPGSLQTFPQCHGESVCSIAQTTSQVFLQNCCNYWGTCFYSNVMHIKYSCVPIVKPNVTTVSLPLPHDVTGQTLRIHSPYYPCNTPSLAFSFTCTITAADEFAMRDMLSLELDVFTKFHASSSSCSEKLALTPGTEQETPINHCSEVNRVISRERLYSHQISPNKDFILQFTYSKFFGREGGKFVIQTKVYNKNSEPVDLRISCDNQDYIAISTTIQPPSQPSASLSGGCQPLTVDYPTPTTTTMTNNREAEGNAGSEYNADKATDSIDHILIGVLTAVFAAIIIVLIIVICLGCRRRRRRQLSKSQGASGVNGCPKPPEETSMAIYSVAGAVAETSNLQQNNRMSNEYQNGAVPMYAVIDKGSKIKGKNRDIDGKDADPNSHVMNDVISDDTGDVMMCENTELYVTAAANDANTAIGTGSAGNKDVKDYENVSAREKLKVESSDSKTVSKDARLYDNGKSDEEDYSAVVYENVQDGTGEVK